MTAAPTVRVVRPTRRKPGHDYTPLAKMSDEVGALVPNTDEEQAAALLAVLRNSTSADEAARFRALLGLPQDGA